MFASSAGRVAANTAFDVNMEINDRFHDSVAYYSSHLTEIPARLKEIDREWDIERALATGATSLSLLGVLLGLFGRPRFFLLTLAVQGFYMQHTLRGWCPPLPVLRQLGFRTATEIEREKGALKDILREIDPDSAGATGTVLSEVTVGVFEIR